MIPDCFDGVSHGLMHLDDTFRIVSRLMNWSRRGGGGRSWLMVVALVAVGLQGWGGEIVSLVDDENNEGRE